MPPAGSAAAAIVEEPAVSPGSGPRGSAHPPRATQSGLHRQPARSPRLGLRQNAAQGSLLSTSPQPRPATTGEFVTQQD
jgi:hypothetical protein